MLLPSVRDMRLLFMTTLPNLSFAVHFRLVDLNDRCSAAKLWRIVQQMNTANFTKFLHNFGNHSPGYVRDESNVLALKTF